MPEAVTAKLKTKFDHSSTLPRVAALSDPSLEQIRDLSGSSFDSDRAWALAMQLRARVVLQGWLSEPHPTTGEA